MRFKVNKYKSRKEGEERIINKFLFIPVILNDELRWLEKVEFVQRMEKDYCDVGYSLM